MTTLENFTGVYREYHDKNNTQPKSEVFMHNKKKKVYINYNYII